VIGSRGAAALLAVVAVAALLAGCEPATGGAAGAAPTGEASSVAPGGKTTTGAPTATPKPGSSATPTAKPKPKPTKPAALLEPGDRGEKVRELQHRLRQLDWYSGSITGTYGSKTTKAVKGFQQKREIAVTGRVDAHTWTVLVKRTRTPTRAERHNVLVPGRAILKRGSSGLRVRDLQARLKQIGWFSVAVSGRYGSTTAASVRGFQAKRRIPVTGEVDQRTLDRLRAMTRTPTKDELYNRLPRGSASGLDRRCLTGRAICISKRTDSLVWVVGGRPRLRMDVRFGSDRTPTREGWFSVGWKARHHVSSIYHSSMPYAMFFSGGQAVHYSSDFAARGYNGASHGCVNVRNLAGIQSLFAQVRVGDKVIVYR
jgi:peptidoglycan hydrolase-like protein with peptidoglycan-binding domain